jgi:hypothetical protein
MKGHKKNLERNIHDLEQQICIIAEQTASLREITEIFNEVKKGLYSELTRIFYLTNKTGLVNPRDYTQRKTELDSAIVKLYGLIFGALRDKKSSLYKQLSQLNKELGVSSQQK